MGQLIEGVLMHPLKKISDERGMILHMMKSTDSHFEKFGEIYFATAYPGVIKGWHEHKRQTQFYAVIQGMIKLVLFDNRADSATYKSLMELYIGEDNYQLVRIPVGVVNGYKNIGTKTALIANCTTHAHETDEMVRFDPHGETIPYKWARVDR